MSENYPSGREIPKNERLFKADETFMERGNCASLVDQPIPVRKADSIG
jgi:hypothetical protein